MTTTLLFYQRTAREYDILNAFSYLVQIITCVMQYIFLYLLSNVNFTCLGRSTDCMWLQRFFLLFSPFISRCYLFPYYFHELQTQLKPNQLKEIDFAICPCSNACALWYGAQHRITCYIHRALLEIHSTPHIMHLINHVLMLHKFYG